MLRSIASVMLASLLVLQPLPALASACCPAPEAPRQQPCHDGPQAPGTHASAHAAHVAAGEHYAAGDHDCGGDRGCAGCQHSACGHAPATAALPAAAALLPVARMAPATTRPPLAEGHHRRLLRPPARC